MGGPHLASAVPITGLARDEVHQAIPVPVVEGLERVLAPVEVSSDQLLVGQLGERKISHAGSRLVRGEHRASSEGEFYQESFSTAR